MSRPWFGQPVLELSALFEISLLLLLSWGALAFGAEYPWAYSPLLVFSLVTGLLGLRTARGALPSRVLLLTLGLVFLGGVLQFLPARLIPLDLQSPPTVNFGRLYALVTMQPAPQGTSSAISIAPSRTLLGLAFLGTFTFLFAGCTRAISAFGPKRLINGIVILGAAVAFIGLIQASVQSETIYGFWRQPRVGAPFAPFMNKNHFTGWVAMVISLAIGSFAGDVDDAFRKVKPDWRNRLLWLSSQRASGIVLTFLALALMALSIVIATSRGGLIGLLLILTIVLMLMLRRQVGWRRIVGVGCIVATLLLVLSWGGATRTIDRFSGAAETLGDRRQIWADTWRIIKDYPITGTGLNTYGIAMLHYQRQYLVGSAVTEAHNDYLQLAAEGGLVLCIPILLALSVFCRQVWLRFSEGLDDEATHWNRKGAVIGLCAIAVMSIFDFTLQMPGAAAMFIVLAAIAVHRPNHLKHKAPASAAGLRR
jgi:O-antigen ligase